MTTDVIATFVKFENYDNSSMELGCYGGPLTVQYCGLDWILYDLLFPVKGNFINKDINYLLLK